MATKTKFLAVIAVLLMLPGTQLAMAQDLDYSESTDDTLVDEGSEVMVDADESDESSDSESSDDF